MASEITRIASATDFNGIYLLNGNLSSSTHDGAGLNPAGKLKVHFGTGNSSSEDYYYIQIGTSTASAFGIGLGADPNNLSYVRFLQAMKDGQNKCYAAVYDNQISLGSTIANAKAAATADSQAQYNLKKGYYDEGYGTLQGYNDLIALGYSESEANRAGTDSVTAGINDNLTSLQERSFGLGFLNSSARNAGLSISTQELAQHALTVLNDAIVAKDKIRANLGALQNRLENTISNLQIQAENLMAAESQISDVDVASEMTEFVRQQILTQSAVAMLAQANSLPKMAMQLISG